MSVYFSSTVVKRTWTSVNASCVRTAACASTLSARSTVTARQVSWAALAPFVPCLFRICRLATPTSGRRSLSESQSCSSSSSPSSSYSSPFGRRSSRRAIPGITFPWFRIRLRPPCCTKPTVGTIRRYAAPSESQSACTWKEVCPVRLRFLSGRWRTRRVFPETLGEPWRNGMGTAEAMSWQKWARSIRRSRRGFWAGPTGGAWSCAAWRRICHPFHRAGLTVIPYGRVPGKMRVRERSVLSVLVFVCVSEYVSWLWSPVFCNRSTSESTPGFPSLTPVSSVNQRKMYDIYFLLRKQKQNCN